MGKTSIEWTDESWNPIVGCTEVSPGCANCYAARLAATLLKNTPQYIGLAELLAVNAHKNKTRWTREVRFLPERLEEPLHWKKPRRIFVCDMGDLFHEDVDWETLHKVFAVIRHCQRHTFQILTKRPQRMLDYLTHAVLPWAISAPFPLANVWLGVSVENQHFADERIPPLLDTPAAVRWISAEPLLGPVYLEKPIRQWQTDHRMENRSTSLDWVVCGGESGHNARPMQSYWACSLRDQCVAAGVPFFFKQWGEWHPGDVSTMIRMGKKKAGRMLFGREWNEFPQNGAAHVPGKVSVGDQK